MTTFDDTDNDIVSSRIKGAAPDWGGQYGIHELWTEVLPGLFVGGTADDDTVANEREGRQVWSGEYVVTDDAEITPEDFDAVVTLYAWARPVDWLVEEYRWGIFDGNSYEIQADDVLDVVKWVHKRWKSGKKVLLRCQAGLSRSAFMTALVLVRDGMEVQQAVDLIRTKRSGHCLNMNGSSARGQFTRMLRETPVEFWRD